jgi:pyrrolidone-carboxylate peptidase
MQTRVAITLGVLCLLCITSLVSGIQLCPGQEVDDTGRVPIGLALQRCLDQAIKSQKPLSIPAGIYLMNHTLQVHAGELSTQGVTATCIHVPSSKCAVLKAHSTLNDSLIVAQYLSIK